MPPKKRPPAPIDRPLSKAYLREFGGWSTAYPPGLSDPNSIRVMENVQITREGAARVRPGLQSYLRTKSPLPIVGSHELFYTERGKAYLVAVRETVDVGTSEEREVVGFRVIGDIDGSGVVVMDTLAAFGFAVPSDPDALTFTAATTYVRYLQIDNKIFALSNAPEGMLMFWVGTEKKAKKLQSITRPAWNVADKLVARQPAGSWILANQPTATRQNLCRNPDFEASTTRWSAGNPATTSVGRTEDANVGNFALRARSRETRQNWITSPLHNAPVTGTGGWTGSFDAVLSTTVSAMQITTAPSEPWGSAYTDLLEIPAGEQMRLAFDLVAVSNVGSLKAYVNFYNSSGEYLSRTYVIDTTSTIGGRRTSSSFTVPAGASFARVHIGAERRFTTGSARIDIKDVCLSLVSMGTAALDGDDGTYYHWLGTPNASRSVYWPPVDIYVRNDPVSATPGSYTVSADINGAAGRTVEIEIRALNSSGSTLLVQNSSSVGTGAYVRRSVTIAAPTGTTQVETRVYLRGSVKDEWLYVDAVLTERAGSAGTYFSGNTANSGSFKRRWSGAANDSISIEDDFAPTVPTTQTPSADTLVSNTASRNRYNFSFFYTISNDLGESAASQVTTIKTQRPWTAWQWLDPNGVDTNDPELCHDQLTVTMPEAVFDAAVASGATHWTAYYFMQGPNDAPSVTAMRFAEIDLSSEPTYGQHGYARLTPQMVKIGVSDPLIPSESTRFNSSNPVKGSQGLVAADRLILVGNPADPARISWSSGAPGDYHNFSPLLGGGSKQLTSGNLYVTAAVKLWQNPQSVDTLTILNAGDDGRSNAYYMQPAQITSLSESISVMGFEEVTSLPGTVSPYGCEVVNNAMYLPLDHGLLKASANNYNLSMRAVSDTVQNMWRSLQNMHRIVSATLDSRIYYLVHNIFGDALEQDCRGNEVWVIDLAAKTPTWSRWKTQGVSLRTMDVDDAVMMSLVRPDGIFVFNEDRYTDEKFNAASGELETVNIPWYLETNTQGANRAHDAWCNLQQANIMVGNFLGQLRYGIRGQDVNGMPVDIEKLLLSDSPPPVDENVNSSTGEQLKPTLRPTEREDYLLLRKLMKEWVFYAGSVNDVVDEVSVPRFSGGQVNAVQYRYTPATVNVGYEYGSVETFEYGQIYSANATTDSGTPQPYVDLSRA